MACKFTFRGKQAIVVGMYERTQVMKHLLDADQVCHFYLKNGKVTGMKVYDGTTYDVLSEDVVNPVGEVVTLIIAREKSKTFRIRKFRVTPRNVRAMVWAAFHIKEYRTLSELLEITQQPKGYLVKFVRNMCIYSKSYRTWILKDRYRLLPW